MIYSNDNESPDDLKKQNEDDEQSGNSEMNVYSVSGCTINYESEDTLDFTKDCAKESEEDKVITPVDNLTKDFNQLQLE